MNNKTMQGYPVTYIHRSSFVFERPLRSAILALLLCSGISAQILVTGETFFGGQLSATSASNTAVALSPAYLNFGGSPVGSATAPQIVTLTNAGLAPLSIGGIAISGQNAADFVIVNTTCGSTLAAQANCTISLSFSPSATESRAATLLITDSASNSPQTASLIGIGMLEITTTSAGTISMTGATLRWNTNQPFYSPYSCYASYGPTSSYGSSSLTTTTGIVAVSGLSVGSAYHFAVTCTDGSNSVTSPDTTFTTLASLPATPPARTVIDNELLTYVTSQVALPGAVVAYPYSTTQFTSGQADPLSVKGSHSLFQWYGPADQHRLSFAPYDELSAFSTQEMNAGRSGLFITATVGGTHYPVIATTGSNNCYNGKHLIQVSDPRYVRFFANELDRKVLVSQVYPNITDSPYYQSAYGASDEGVFEYNQQSIFPSGCGGSAVVPSVWDQGYPQNEAQYLNAIQGFNYELSQWAPDTGIILNEGASTSEGFNSSLSVNANIANWANVYGTFYGIDHEELLLWGNQQLSGTYLELYNWAWQVANGGLFLARLPVQAANSTGYQVAAIVYTLFRGGNTFFEEETPSGSSQVAPSNYQPILDALGPPTSAFSTIQNGSNAWNAVYTRNFQGGVSVFNFSGASYSYTLPSSLNGQPVSAWYLDNTGTTYTAGTTYSLPDCFSSPSSLCGVYFVPAQGTYVQMPTYYPPTLGQTISGPVTVTLSDGTSGTTICYTTDGSTPTATTAGTCSHGTVYSSPISLSASATVNAIGTQTGDINSWVKTASYTISGNAPTVQFQDKTDSAPAFYTDDYAEIVLSNPTVNSVSVSYSISASGGVTISPAGGTLTFRPYETKRAIYFKANLTTGSSGRVTITLSNPTNSTLGTNTTFTYTITTDSVTNLERFANLPPIANAEVNSNTPASTSDTNQSYFLTGTYGPTGAHYRSLWKYDLTQIPSNATIVSAQIKLYSGNTVDGSNGGTMNTSIYRMTSNWAQGTATWNNSGGVSSNYAASASSTANPANFLQVNAPTVDLNVYWDVTADVQNIVNGTYASNYGWVLVGPESTPTTCGTGGTGSGSSLCTEQFTAYNNNYADSSRNNISRAQTSLLVTYTIPNP